MANLGSTYSNLNVNDIKIYITHFRRISRQRVMCCSNKPSGDISFGGF